MIGEDAKPWPNRLRTSSSSPTRSGKLREARREDILKVLLIRFVSDAKEFEEELKAGLKGIVDDSRLEQLFEYTLRCADVFYFRQALLPGSGGRASKVDPEVRREIIAEWVQQNLKIDLGILEDTIALEKRHAALSATQNSILVVARMPFWGQSTNVGDQDQGYRYL